jgi:hypothetical protein
MVQRTIIVTGLPRSGTSLLMQMLSGGGVPVLTDDLRTPDTDNPRGYFELEAVKRTDRDSSWLAQAPGKAVKVVAPLLPHLPQDLAYDVLFIERPIEEVLRSQAAMMARRGLPSPTPDEDAALRGIFEKSLVRANAWLAAASHARVLRLAYPALVAEPQHTAEQIAGFLSPTLDIAVMTKAVDPTLHRNRA